MREPLISASLVLDDEDKIVEFNGDVYDFLGVEGLEIQGKLFPQIAPDIYRILQRLISKGKRGRGVEGYALSLKIGKRLLGVKVSVIPYPLPALGKNGILISMATMEERSVPPAFTRKEASEPSPLTGETGEREAVIADGIPYIGDPLVLINRRGEIEYANHALLRLLNYSMEELKGLPFYSLLFKGESRKTVEQVMETAHLAPWRGEVTLQDREGNEVILCFTFNAFRDREGSLSILGIAKDFTELRKMWNKKEYEANRLWEMMEKAGVAMFSFTPDQRITFWNKQAEKLLSLTLDRAIGMSVGEIFGEMAEKEFSSLTREASRLAKTVERVISLTFKKDARQIFRFKVSSLDSNESLSQEYICCVEDITEYKDRELAVLRKEIAWELMLNLASLARTGKRLEDYLYESLCEVMKALEARAGGVYIFEGGYAILKAHHGISENFLRKAERWRIRPTRLEIFRESPGVIIDIEANGGVGGLDVLKPVLRDWDSMMGAIIEDGLLLNYILPIVTREKTLGVVVLGNYKRERLDEIGLDSMANLGSILGMGAEKALLSEEMERELQLARRIITMKDDYIRLVSHEMGTPLTYIHGYAEMLKEGVSQMDAESVQDKLKSVILGCERLMHIRESLQRSLQLERGKLSGTVETVEPERFFRETLAKQDFLKDRLIEIDFPQNIPSFKVDSFLLGEALYQLLYNAERMSPPGEKIVIRGEEEADEVVFHIEYKSVEESVIVQERLFRDEEEETATEIEANMSLDTYLVKHFLEKLGGRIEIKTEPASGTVITLRLPIGGMEEK